MSESNVRQNEIAGGITEERYNRIIAGVLENMPEGQGFNNRLNIYTCELVEYQDKSRRMFQEPDGCGSIVITRDVDEGVTPGFILCPTCGGNKTMISSFYRVSNQAAREGSQWYRPSFEEYQKLGPASREHVLRGGLLLRPYQKAEDNGADSKT